MSDGLYHGTRVPFTPGGLILPASLTGAAENSSGLVDPETGEKWTKSRGGWVYVTTDIELAKFFARTAVGKGKAKVFEVKFTGVIKPDDATFGGEERESYKVMEAVVVKRVWVEDEVWG